MPLLSGPHRRDALHGLRLSIGVQRVSTHRSDPAASDLIQACLEGRQAAWNELVDRYGRLVFSVPRRLGLSESDAEDVMQTVFLALFRNLERLKDHTRLSAWLLTAAHREAWRVGKMRRTAALGDAIDDRGTPSESDLERWELQETLRRGLEALGGRCEELLRALYLGRAATDFRSVARELDMPIGSIGPTRARCLKKLEAALLRDGLQLDATVSGES